MEDSKYFKEERDKIVRGLEEAYRKLVLFKKQKNSPLVVSRNGKIVEIAPDKILSTVSYKRNHQ